MKLLHVPTRAAWRRWLQTHHQSTTETWLVYHKKHTGKPRVAYDAAVEEALRFGWIDGLVRRVDEARFAQRFTPRRPGSVWSPANIERVRRLVDQNRMAPAGLVHAEKALRGEVKIQAAPKGDLPMPTDLKKALGAREGAWQQFESFPPSCRRAYLHWIASAKRPETRARRITEAVKLVVKNVRRLMK
jgi:uncharacterized protein YdeI (YjbR/CyaY-like superfamily)